MMDSDGHVNFAAIKQLQTEISYNTKSLCMMESNSLANIVAIKQIQTEVFKYIKILCMLESNTPGNIALIKQPQTEVLKNTKSLCMMESNTSPILLNYPLCHHSKSICISFYQGTILFLEGMDKFLRSSSFWGSFSFLRPSTFFRSSSLLRLSSCLGCLHFEVVFILRLSPFFRAS